MSTETPPKRKKRTVNEHIATGEKAADVLKDFTDDKTDRKIDKAVTAVKVGGGIFSMLKSIFGK